MIAKSHHQPAVTLLSLIEQACVLSQQLERGQASTPISDAFQSLGDGDDSAQLSVAVLCLSPALRSAVDVWSNSDGFASSRVTVRVADCHQLLIDIGCYQRFCIGSQLLLIVGDASESLDATKLDLARDVVNMFPLVWPIVTSDQPNCACTWWPQLQSQRQSGQQTSCMCPPTSSSDMTSVTAETLSRLREPLIVHAQTTTFYSLIEKLTLRVEHELKYLKDQVARLEVPAKTNSVRGSDNNEKELVQIRERFAEQAASLDRQMTLKSDRSTQPLGELSGMLRSIASSLNVEDLEQNRTSSTFKLSVNASHLARINRRIEHVLRQEFVSDLQCIERQVQRAAGDLGGALAVKFGVGVPLKFPTLDVNHAWRSVENLMAIGKEAHIEFARKGFFDVLTAGRQKVFIIIMFVSLMGRMGLPNLFSTPASQAGFGLFMAAVMIGSMVNAVLHWRYEKQTQSEKEMTKIRETLLSEGSKVIEQVEKAKLAAIRDYLKEAVRTFDLTVKQFVEDSATQQRIKRESELQKQDLLRKALESRIKLTSDIQRQLTKLVEQARTQLATTVATVRDLAASWHRDVSIASNDTNPTQLTTEKESQVGNDTKPGGLRSLLVASAPCSTAVQGQRSSLRSATTVVANAIRTPGGLAQRRERRNTAAKIAGA